MFSLTLKIAQGNTTNSKQHCCHVEISVRSRRAWDV